MYDGLAASACRITSHNLLMANTGKTGNSASTYSPHILEILRKKRHGHELSRAEIEHFVHAYTKGEIPDYQAAAWLMAAVVRGLSRAETAHLTDAMLHSGQSLDLSHLAAKKVDKHSTGGVGDKTSLIVAPIAAAAGLIVPMNSGRGLGHTGGTLDKLEAIPGFTVALSVDEFRRVLEGCGCAIVSQTAEIAPADRKLYHLRNFTSTIDHPSLICASIMSKKLAEGIDGLVLDVKTGSGAFMKEESEAVELAELMVETAQRLGVKAVALITDMNQPLGTHIGNALEVAEVLDVLHGGGADDLRELSLELAAWMLLLGERAASVEAGRQLAEELIRKGHALERFRQMIALQGGHAGTTHDRSLLPHAHHHKEMPAATDGYVGTIDCEGVGMASVFLGAGREGVSDEIDHAVGLVLHKKPGDAVKHGEPICTIHYNSEERLRRAESLLEGSITITSTKPSRKPLIRRIIHHFQG